MKNFKLNGISINDFGGKGSPLIFIHAFPLCSRMWDSQAEYFKDKFRVITYDLRGLGYSNETGDYSFTMEELVNDLFFVIDEMKLGKVNACGLSVGSYILLRAIVKDSSKFNSVILASANGDAENNTSLLARSEMIINLKNGKREEILDAFIKRLVSEESYKNDALVKFIKTMMSWMDTKGICSVLLAIATRTRTVDQLKGINIPALIIAGKEDIIVPPVKSLFIHENIAGSEFNVINGAGHLCNMEAPDEFNRIIDEFLSRLK